MNSMTDTFDKGNAAFIAKRYASERRFKAYGAVALAVSVLFLVYLIVDIGIKAWPSFFEHRVVLEVNLDASKIPANDVLKGDFEGVVKDWAAEPLSRRDNAGRRAEPELPPVSGRWR